MRSAATSEKTPLLDAAAVQPSKSDGGPSNGTGKPSSNSRGDSSVAVQPSKSGGPSNGTGKPSSNGLGDSTSSKPDVPAKRVKGNLPSWRDAFREIAPFLKPQDTKHMVLAALALLAVMLDKLVAVLPPLAIRRAVDVIAAFGGSGDLDENEYGELKRSTFETVTWSIGSYFLLKTLDSAISSFQTICQRSVSLDAERRFATSLFRHMQVLGAAYHLERHGTFGN